jgi:translation initiation factor 2B subunit (eIF-2B alpha/beta/delta family)
MLAAAFHDVVMGLSRFQDAVRALETELKTTQETVVSLQDRIRYLENTQDHHKSVLEDLTVAGIPRNDADLETLIDDRIDSILEMRLDDEIESRLSGREIEAHITVTL